jgi:hypothetical protein
MTKVGIEFPPNFFKFRNKETTRGLSDYRCKNCLLRALFFLSFILAYVKSLPDKKLNVSETAYKEAREM